MTSFSNFSNFLQLAFLILLFGQFISSSKVAFYESVNYTGLIQEAYSNGSCVNLPTRSNGKVNSLKTDSCILFYKGGNCTSTSIKVTVGSYSNLANVTHAHGEHFGNSIRSFHRCNQFIGSSDTVNVNFYEENEMIAEYKNICGCITLPDMVNPATRLDNHGTCLRLYLSQFGTTPDCTGSYQVLQGGTSYLSENLENLTHSATSWRRIAAISPCTKELSKCVKLEAIVYKFEIDSDPIAVSKYSSSSDISMSITTTFRNNGSATVSEEYSAKKTITEITETSLVKGYSSMENWTVETGVTTEISADIPLVSKSSVTASLKSAYTKEETHSSEESEMKRTETTTEFGVNQKIEIKPCTMYNVNSFVRMIHNYPVNYKVFSKVSGKMGDRKLTAKEVKERLEGLEYVEDFDDCTIIAKGYGTMNVDYGMETVIDGEGMPIEGCWSRDGLNANERSQMLRKRYGVKKSGSEKIILINVLVMIACQIFVYL